MTWPPTTHQHVQDAVTVLRDAGARTTVQKVTASLAANASEQSTVSLAPSAEVFRVAADKPCRVRLYTTAAKQSADVNRAAGTDPTGDHGVSLDVVLTASMLSLDLSPVPTVADLKATPDGLIPITITNTGTSAQVVTVTLTYTGGK